MDRVLLKRLLGAGVIVALAVIVLPFLLQGEGYKAALRTDIPPRPQPPQPLDTASHKPPAEARELLKPPPPLPIAQVSRTEAANEAKEGEAAKLFPKPVAPLVFEDKSASKPASTAQATTARPASEASKPEPASHPASKPAAEPSSAASMTQEVVGAWMIQLGSFSAESNAQQLRDQVQRVGMACQIDPLDIQGRKAWRVRAGPFASRAEAEAALKRLQGDLGLGGLVIKVR